MLKFAGVLLAAALTLPLFGTAASAAPAAEGKIMLAAAGGPGGGGFRGGAGGGGFRNGGGGGGGNFNNGGGFRNGGGNAFRGFGGFRNGGGFRGPRGGFRGGYGYRGSRFRGGAYFGSPFLYDPFWPYPYYGYGYGYGPGFYDYPSSTVVIRGRPAPPGYLAPDDEAGAPPEQFWYYCNDPQGYYPYISQCNQGWQQVPVTPSDLPQGQEPNDRDGGAPPPAAPRNLQRLPTPRG